MTNFSTRLNRDGLTPSVKPGDVPSISKEMTETLGLALSQWHTGGDYVHQTGSFLLAGKVPELQIANFAMTKMVLNVQYYLSRLSSNEVLNADLRQEFMDCVVHGNETIKLLAEYITRRTALAIIERGQDKNG